MFHVCFITPSSLFSKHVYSYHLYSTENYKRNSTYEKEQHLISFYRYWIKLLFSDNVENTIGWLICIKRISFFNKNFKEKIVQFG